MGSKVGNFSRKEFLKVFDAGAALSGCGGLLPGCGPTLREKLSVEPRLVRGDEPFVVRLKNLPPGERVVLTAAFDDASGYEWTSTAVFEADGESGVDTSGQAPVEGAYEVKDPMGLVWGALGSGFYSPPVGASSVRPKARLGDEEASAEVERYDLAEGACSEDVRGDDGLVGRLFSPAGGEGTNPGVLVLSGSEGGINPHLEREGALLASRGYAAMALAYFRGEAFEPEGAERLPATPTSVPLEYFERALAWLGGRGGADPERLGVLGHSRSGELALLLEATYPERVKAVVSYVGGGAVASSPEGDEPVWTYRGEPLPHLPFAEDSSSITDEDLERAEIPVERINGPVLLVGAGDDAVWPSGPVSGITYERLRRHDRPHEDALAVYPEAGHALGAPYVPTGGSLYRTGGTAEANAEANEDAWRKATELLDGRIKG